MAVNDARHRGQRRLRARDEVRALQAMTACVDDYNIFALECCLVEGEVLRAEVRGVVLGARRAADQIDQTVHSGGGEGGNQEGALKKK